jgi:hypothetical protein
MSFSCEKQKNEKHRPLVSVMGILLPWNEPIQGGQVLESYEDYRKMTPSVLRRCFRKSLEYLRSVCHTMDIKAFIEFLKKFQETFQHYKIYKLENKIFNVLKSIIQQSHVRHNQTIQSFLEHIGEEIQEVQEFIAPKPQHSLFAGVMPWHDYPFRMSIEFGDIDQLKKALHDCLVQDDIHNDFLCSEKYIVWQTYGLWKAYIKKAKDQGLWDENWTAFGSK